MELIVFYPDSILIRIDGTLGNWLDLGWTD